MGFCEEERDVVLSFVAESRDVLDNIEPILIELNDFSDGLGESGEEIVNSIFRAFHSIKGSAGFLDFKNISKVTHEAETLLDLYRKGEHKPTSYHIDVLCKTTDFIRTVMGHIEQQMSDEGFEEDGGVLVTELKEVINDKPQNKQESSVNSTGSASSSLASMDLNLDSDILGRFVQESEELLESTEQALLELRNNPGNYTDLVAESFRNIHSFKGNCGMFGYPDLERLSHKMESILDYFRNNAKEDNKDNIDFLLKIIDILRSTIQGIAAGEGGQIASCDVMITFLEEMIPTDKGKTKAADTANANNDQKEKKTPKVTNKEVKSAARRDIRVDLNKLDSLINLVGELITASAMVTNNPDLKGYNFENFERASGHMTKIVRELQEISISVRMVPVSSTFRKMVRLVHDVSRKEGKSVKLDIRGEETEVDKTVAELIGDPLVHIIRNSVDHGIESQKERQEAGKSPEGNIILSAKHESGEIWITIKDDGAGLNKDRILKKAIECGLINGDGSDMADEDIYKLIFNPGFSTAEKVTDVSGRGVGMDVVKRNIEEKLKGSIDIKSEYGKGCTLTIRLPLTLAIIEGMLLRVGKARYTIPMLSIQESIRIHAKNITVTTDGQEIVKLRDELYPVIRLHKIQNIKPDYDKLSDGILIVVATGKKRACLFVDEILGQYQTVIKGISPYISDIGDLKKISGCTILGNGDVSLILDPAQILEA